MDMKYRYSIILLVTLLLFSSCEKEFSLSELDKTSNSLVANAIVYTDSTFSVSITNSYEVDDAPLKILRTFMKKYSEGYYYGFIRGAEWTHPHDIIKFDFNIDGSASEMYKNYVNRTAAAIIKVNDKDEYTLTFNEFNCMYESDYVAKEGDVIQLYAEGYTDSLQRNKRTIKSTISIPEKPEIELLDIRYEYKKVPGEWNGISWQYLGGDIDTVAYITLKLHDFSKKKNYYKLKIRTYSLFNEYRGDRWDWTDPGSGTDEDGWFLNGEYVDIPPQGEFIWHLNDIYRSNDVLFRDERLSRGFSGWSEKFSNVFDDKLFNDGEYIVEVETRILRGTDRKIRIELQSLTEDYYQFLKSWMVFRITSDDDFAEQIYIHSNVKNGYGIVGAINSDIIVTDMIIPQTSKSDMH